MIDGWMYTTSYVGVDGVLCSAQIIALIGVLVLLMFITFCSRLIASRVFEPHHWYLGLGLQARAAHQHSQGQAAQGDDPQLVQYGFSLVSSFILFHTIIPISLAITVEGVKFIQSYLLTWDLELYDKAADRPAAAHLSSLSEELGLIRFVFSDKTGARSPLTQHSFPCRVPCLASIMFFCVVCEYGMQVHVLQSLHDIRFFAYAYAYACVCHLPTAFSCCVCEHCTVHVLTVPYTYCKCICNVYKIVGTLTQNKMNFSACSVGGFKFATECVPTSSPCPPPPPLPSCF